MGQWGTKGLLIELRQINSGNMHVPTVYEYFRGPVCCELLYNPAGMQHMPDKLHRKMEVVTNELLYPVVINTDYVKRCVFG